MKLSTILAALLAALNSYAQSDTATLRGTINDPQGRAVSGARVVLKNKAQSTERQMFTDDSGAFLFSQISPSTYSLTAEKTGFSLAEYSTLALSAGDQNKLAIQLSLGRSEERVTVTGEAPLIRESSAVGTVIDRQVIENQPLNGRSFQSLVELSPGVVLTPSNLPNPGQFSVNGQRAGSNYFTVDGVGANFGSTASTNLYETAGGGVPSYSAMGTTSSLASLDAVQEFTIQTSTYAPEYGRQPGAQVTVVTRSGTNQLHGRAYDYVRNSAFDANNYFANRNGLAKPPVKQNDFGFTTGGPVFIPHVYNGKDKTFFFFSYEGVRLRSPFVTESFLVPSLTARQNSTGPIKDILNAFPLPTGLASASKPLEAPYIASFTNPLTLNATSFRIDHRFNDRVTVFGRYNHAPSEDRERARYCISSCVALLQYQTDTATFGSTQIVSTRVNNDVRFNYSRARVKQSYYIDSFGGAVVPPVSSLYPSFTNGDRGYIYIELNSSGSNTLSDGLFSDNRQRQLNVTDTMVYTFGSHSLKLGGDYRYLTPENNAGQYKRQYLPDNVTDLVNNAATSAAIIAPQFILHPIYKNLSLFAQDTWRVSPRLTLTYGLRYEVNPSPSEANGNLPLSALNVETPSAITLAPRTQRLYETSYGNVAPRVGVSYQLSPQGRTVIRGGFGMFHDLGYTFSGNALNAGAYPFAGTLNLTSTFTSTAFAATPPPVSLNPPYTRVFAYGAGFELPYTLQYNLTLEHGIRVNDVVSLAYVGSIGRRLGRVESLRNPNPNFARIDVVRSAAVSDYNSLQLQYRRRMSKGLQLLSSYTFSKSLDTVSEESPNNLQSPSGKFQPGLDNGPSSFDVRHNMSSAISYQFRSPASGLTKALFGGFSLDSIIRSRSSLPVNVLTGRDPFGLRITTVARPDVVAGVPLYLSDSNVAGGRRFNPAALDGTTPLNEKRQGTLGRNVFRGFPATQLDFSLRREFALHENAKLQFRADAFNVLNHANFALPVGTLTDPNFGRSTQMLASGLGGLSPLYQIGGPRSIQLALKLIF